MGGGTVEECLVDLRVVGGVGGGFAVGAGAVAVGVGVGQANVTVEGGGNVLG